MKVFLKSISALKFIITYNYKGKTILYIDIYKKDLDYYIKKS